ncbi:hypothetical protein ACFCXK_25215 [Streptomyces sp. NPDC056269]|uniref:hypothetical protein n=1 Tax=Streptomyces sp. NPDC056269 TaxID=3345768 RepID=UPI0035DB8446
MAVTLVGCASEPTTSENGELLGEGTQSAGVVGSDEARIGQEWTIALPVLQNVSDSEIKVTGARVDHVPEGLRVLGYTAYNRYDTEGVALLSYKGAPGMPDFGKFKDYAGSPIPVRANSEADIYYMVKVKVTGRVEGNIEGATFSYRSDGRLYEQSLPFEAALKLTENRELPAAR